MPLAREPEDLDHFLAAALARGDVDAVVALYEENAVFADEGVPKMVGHGGLHAGFERLAAQGLRISPQPRVVARVGDLAIVYNDWTETGTDADGRSFERAGKAIEVVRRQPDGSWRYVFDDPYARG